MQRQDTTPAREGWVYGIDRGPEWLFVRLERPADGIAAGANSDGTEVSDAVLATLRENLVQRVVLELDDIGTLDDTLVDAIAELDRRLGNGGGTLRICGLSEANLARLRTRSGLADMPHFAGRLEAAGPRTGMPGRPLAR
jgi:anti-anti-sigma regulatory factor